jgi:molybdenum cofactor cytidylyltransferase
MSEKNIGIVILAGGCSSKLGTPKQLVEFKGKRLLRNATEVALRCSCEHVIVVLGSRADEIYKEISDLPIETVINGEWTKGISTSLKAGLVKLMQSNPDVSAAVVMLSDQPFVSEKTVRSLIEVYAQSGNPIVASEYDGVLGVPALFDREVFDELLALQGDAGARVVIRKSEPTRIAAVKAPEAAFDVDTPADHQRLKELEFKSR